jgi:hypothetical protein
VSAFARAGEDMETQGVSSAGTEMYTLSEANKHETIFDVKMAVGVKMTAVLTQPATRQPRQC